MQLFFVVKLNIYKLFLCARRALYIAAQKVYNHGMPCDMITLKALAAELTSMLEGGRINKIQSADRALYFGVRAKGKNGVLTLSYAPNAAGIYLTRAINDAAGVPGNFCMCLRKHLTGAVIDGFDIVNEDRIVGMRLTSKNELNDAARYTLYAEIMGGASNVILADASDTVIDAARRIMNENSRPMYPRVIYVPPTRGKTELSLPEAAEILLEAENAAEVYGALNGLSKASAEELLYLKNAVGAEKALARMNNLYSSDVYRPGICSVNGGYYAYPYEAVKEDFTETGTLSRAVDMCLGAAAKVRAVAARSAKVRKLLKALEKKTARHIAEDLETIQNSDRAERYKELGEILKCNIHRMERGMSIIECDDFYNTRSVKIELNPTFSPKKNIEHYFKLYSKAKGAKAYAEEDLKRSEEMSDKIRELKTYISNCTAEAEFNEIEAELNRASGKRAAHGSAMKVRAPKKTPPYSGEYKGYIFYVGRNSAQNERVTFELASPGDVWLHAKGFHGGHGIVVKKSGDVPADVIEYVARIVAGYSECAASGRADVDYTVRSRVKRLKGTRVTYTGQKTVSVEPLRPDER